MIALSRCAREPVEIMTLRGVRSTVAWRHGDWAAHDGLVPGRWTLTLLPIGLALPPDWCCFDTAEAAAQAMIALGPLKNDWSAITQADLTLALRDRIRAVCEAHGARPGPVGLAHLAGLSTSGRPLPTRPNGYAAPAA